MASAGGAQQSDVRQRTVLPQMLHGRQLQSTTTPDDNLTSDEYLDKMEEELNRRVDDQIDVLRDGMAELVRLTDIQGKDHYRLTQEAFQSEIRTESIIRASHSLLSLSHTLKLLHLFADTATPTATRERISAQLSAEIAKAQAKVKELVAAGDGEGGAAGGQAEAEP